jgi:AraC family transcriptional regulator of adaptative response / DNA-3-methyladenine glycosylase II
LAAVNANDPLSFDQCYRAVESRDARFDGWFIVAVHTTGIYCRPSCPTPVRPKATNVTFYRSAAAAQLAGYRACKRCRPDAVPGSPEWDARADLAGRAMRLIADGVVDRDGVSGLARRLAVSERHLHRILVKAVGAPPLALARSQRAQTARVLVETTGLAFSEIAFASGFPSIRQFNETIQQVFAATPTGLRGARRRGMAAEPGRLSVRLAFRSPYDREGALTWLSARAVPGLEEAVDGNYRRALSLPGGPATVALAPGDDHVRASFRLASIRDLAAAATRCRRLLDLDADPATLHQVLGSDRILGPLVAAVPGLRVLGSVDGKETAIRVVLGQQISLRAARAVTGRLIAMFGKPLDQADETVSHAFPAPDALAEATLDGLGLTSARARTVRELAARLATGQIVVDPGADRVEARRRLLEVPGIGAWTAEMIALRGLGDPDAFPAGDLGLLRAAVRQGLAPAPAELTRHAERWRPWRAYGAHYLWR